MGISKSLIEETDCAGGRACDLFVQALILVSPVLFWVMTLPFGGDAVNPRHRGSRC